MVRDPEPEQEVKPAVIERVINQELLNAKLNELLNVTYKIAQKTGVDLTAEE